MVVSSLEIAKTLIDQGIELSKREWVDAFEKYVREHPEIRSEFRQKGKVRFPSLGVFNAGTIVEYYEQLPPQQTGGLQILNLNKPTVRMEFAPAR